MINYLTYLINVDKKLKIKNLIFYSIFSYILIIKKFIKKNDQYLIFKFNYKKNKFISISIYKIIF